MRLRKLILAGFKSFADRTEFLFNDGITCVVGPNGCGKSNIVDAVKWVLGEQSAKSLRGSEMLDVIFNGSSARKASGFAEVTLEFDNEQGLLQPGVAAANEKKPHLVSITRRLYRSGESEYLINGQVVRLKDIREMFMDTGVGTHAYSLIEQGKVAEMLQANPQERRVIFEEAAGISKYKARKKEAQRKLERVDQDLLRLNDILGEVQKRLRSIKYQAGKARSYQAYTEQLSQLRGLFSLAQYHQLRTERSALQAQLDRLTDQLTGIHARIDQLEANGSSTQAEMNDLERQARQTEGEISAIGAQITACEERIDMLRGRIGELDEQIAGAVQRDRELLERIDDAEDAVAARQNELATADLQVRQCAEQIEALLQDQQTAHLELTRLEADLEDEKAGTIDLLRRTSQLHNEITASGVRRESLTNQRQRLSTRADEITRQLTDLIAGRAFQHERMGDIRGVIDEATARLDQAKSESAAIAAEESTLDAEITEAKERRSSLAARHNTLEEMQRKGEGVAEGVRRVLHAREAGRLPAVRGILATFVHTEFAHASLVEAALAGLDQALVFDRMDDLLGARGELEQALNGAGAEVLCLDSLRAAAAEDLPASPVPVTRATDLVRPEAGFESAVQCLLSRTFIVDTLDAARQASAAVDERYRFVARDGAVLEADGRVRLGLARAGAGIISRRSELESLAADLQVVETRIAELVGRRKTASQRHAHLDELQQKLRTAIYEANTERVDCESRLARAGEQMAQLEREQPILTSDIEAIAGEIETAVSAEHQARQKVAELEALSTERQAHIERLTTDIGAARGRLGHLNGLLTEQRVKQAQAVEHKSRIHEAVGQLGRSIERMKAERADAAAQNETNRKRRGDAEEGIVTARANIEQLFARKSDLDQLAAEIQQSRDGLAERLEQIRAELAAQRKAQEDVTRQANQRRVEASNADVRIENLITRTSEELGVDLVGQYDGYEHDSQRDWDAVSSEIRELQDKIKRLGNVNLDAIAEQDELEQRDKFLSEQLADITNSQKQLGELIQKINVQSREMFLATFTAIRENFQAIFRKLFGGGKADILLAEGEDVLEAGIEVIARPPGKELRSISLLSGGEKTMTTVALLFSMFRAKPTPFCILDEVDAALDEANNERFNVIVQEFLDQSQFVIITHSKRTMTVADVLYGVTMQEAGVSKRVSVKFEEAAELVDDAPAAAMAE